MPRIINTLPTTNNRFHNAGQPAKYPIADIVVADIVHKQYQQWDIVDPAPISHFTACFLGPLVAPVTWVRVFSNTKIGICTQELY